MNILRPEHVNRSKYQGAMERNHAGDNNNLLRSLRISSLKTGVTPTDPGTTLPIRPLPPPAKPVLAPSRSTIHHALIAVQGLFLPDTEDRTKCTQTQSIRLGVTVPLPGILIGGTCPLFKVKTVTRVVMKTMAVVRLAMIACLKINDEWPVMAWSSFSSLFEVAFCG